MFLKSFECCSLFNLPSCQLDMSRPSRLAKEKALIALEKNDDEETPWSSSVSKYSTAGVSQGILSRHLNKPSQVSEHVSATGRGLMLRRLTRDVGKSDDDDWEQQECVHPPQHRTNAESSPPPPSVSRGVLCRKSTAPATQFDNADEFECPPPLRQRLPRHLTANLSPPLTAMSRPSAAIANIGSSDRVFASAGDESDGGSLTDSEEDVEYDETESECSGSEADGDITSEDESIDDNVEVVNQASLVSPSGEVWSPTPLPYQGRASSSNILRIRQGITSYATQRIDKDASSAFKAIFDKDILDTIIYETNREGARIKGDKWKSLTNDELDAYIGLCILRGVYKSNGESVRELWNAERGRKIFSSTMSLSRFEEIRRFLHFDNRETRHARQQRDKLAAVRLMLDGVVRNSQKCYQHGPCVTVDEQLCPFRGRCSFIQYMPSKPAKYGLKHWLLCDAHTYYCSNIVLYTGKDSSRGDTSLGEHVVMTMCTHLYGSGRNVTCDNFFTSLSLARSLENKSLTIVGTVRGIRREVPLALRTTKDRQLHSSLFCYSNDGKQLVSYLAKKHKVVIVLSSQHRQPSVSGTPPNKPDVILYYNATKGGVDCIDERVGTYTGRYKTRRWHVRVFSNLIDIVAFNSYILYCDVFPNYHKNLNHRRRMFLLDLGMSLSESYRKKRTEPQVTHSLSSSSALRGRCQLCARANDKKTQTKCVKCDKFICRDHSRFTCSNC